MKAVKAAVKQRLRAFVVVVITRMVSLGVQATALQF
jgi:hypothetical protein